ncbi:MAG: YicC/YloC family endoribonuclease [Planctomycetota bacterium]|jgi:uncharacterized protein (TIGR00255 family)
MLKSMTGFGSAQAEIEGVSYLVEIHSVNSRYVKLNINIPEIWLSGETEIEKLLRSEIHRGSVTINVRMRIPPDLSAYQVNSAALKSYMDQLKMVEMEADPTLRIDLGSLLQLPGVCEPRPLEEICQVTRDGLMKLIREALDGLLQMRRTEGAAVRDDLLAQCDVLESHLAAVRERAPQVVHSYHARLKARVEELTNAARINIDAETLAREVAIFAERCDITEELARLSTHLEQFRQGADSAEPAGRKLDFLAQEMLREANTIGSKGNDVEIARCVVEIKTAIDRIKEQAANVE